MGVADITTAVIAAASKNGSSVESVGSVRLW
jgi:hypothetical protein